MIVPRQRFDLSELSLTLAPAKIMIFDRARGVMIKPASGRRIHLFNALRLALPYSCYLHTGLWVTAGLDLLVLTATVSLLELWRAENFQFNIIRSCEALTDQSP